MTEVSFYMSIFSVYLFGFKAFWLFEINQEASKSNHLQNTVKLQLKGASEKRVVVVNL